MNYGNTLGCRCVADNTQICLEHKVIKVHFADGGYDVRLSGMTTNCVLLRIRLANKGIGGCFGGPRAPDICAWEAARRAPPDGVPTAACDLSRRALACRSAFRRRDAACDRRARLRRRR